MSTPAPFPDGSLVACYLRDSGGAAQELSVDQQELAVRGWCDNNGYTLSVIFADRARPGGSVVGRLEFDRMIRHFQAGAQEAGVVFWDLSRWARSFDDGQFFLSTLRRLGYQAHSLEQYIPPGSIGRVVESLHLWSAEEFRKQLSSNVKRGQSYIITLHHAFPNPHIPAGYRKVPFEIGVRRDGSVHTVNRLEPDPVAGPLVARAFTLRAEGRSIAEVHAATDLHKSRFGYQYMFKNEIYQGTLVYGGLRVEGFCDPLVDPDTWRSVQEINRQWAGWRQSPDGSTHPRRVRSSFLLTGLVRCAECGRAVTGGKYSVINGVTYRYYECVSRSDAKRSKHIRVRDIKLDTAILNLAREFVDNDTFLQSLVDAMRALVADRQGDGEIQVDRLRAELAGIERAARNLLDTLELAGASQALAARLRELEGQRADVAGKLEGAQRALDAQRGYNPQAASQAAITARLKLAQVDTRDRQVALRSIIHEIRLSSSGQGVVIFSLPGLGIDTPVDFSL